MKSRRIILLSILSVFIIFMILIFIILCTNKTFFSTTYIGVGKQKIFIPKYSYFKEECCMTAATFYSLKSEQKLKREIADYLKQFKYFSNGSTYGYEKDNLFIQSYEVINNGLYRKIIIVY